MKEEEDYKGKVTAVKNWQSPLYIAINFINFSKNKKNVSSERVDTFFKGWKNK